MYRRGMASQPRHVVNRDYGLARCSGEPTSLIAHLRYFDTLPR
jgi:hypothetical protein